MNAHVQAIKSELLLNPVATVPYNASNQLAYTDAETRGEYVSILRYLSQS